MNTEQKPVVYEYEEINREIIILFKDTPIIEDESIFKRSHYFKNADNTSITTIFKDELLKLFNVTGVKELKEKIDNKIRLLFIEFRGYLWIGTNKRLDILDINNNNKIIDMNYIFDRMGVEEIWVCKIKCAPSFG